jgi:hypothetical protein
MPLPAIGMLAAGALRTASFYAKGLGLGGSLGLTFGLLSGPGEYERNFDYDSYDKNNARFYSPIWATEDNPEGFNEEMYIEAMDEFHRTKPMY